MSPGSVIGVVGLGLTFHDVLAMLTVGRGGRYVRQGSVYEYIPSGEEPDLIVAGSRSALPIPTREASRQPSRAPWLFTRERIANLRAGGPCDFRTNVLPWLEAEINLAYLQRRLAPDLFALLEQRFLQLPLHPHNAMLTLRQLASEYGYDDTLSLDSLAHPFAGRMFASQMDFRNELSSLLLADTSEAEHRGGVGAFKAAAGVIRTALPTVAAAVDFGGLTAASHKDFVERIGPMLTFLCTGPSAVRSYHLLALMRTGLLEILGPDARFAAHEDGFVGQSPSVAHYSVTCSDVIEARVEPPNFDRDTDLLISKQRAAGAWRAHVRDGNPPFRTGGIDVTPVDFSPIALDGSVQRRIHVLGIPTESTRWFTQTGIGRPGAWGAFFRDADSVAKAALDEIEDPAAPLEQDATVEPGDMDYCFTTQLSTKSSSYGV